MTQVLFQQHQSHDHETEERFSARPSGGGDQELGGGVTADAVQRVGLW